MKSPRPDIGNWWAVEAMIASYNHVYKVTHKTEHKVHGPIGVSIYEDTPIACFQYEFLALSADAQSVMDAVLAYPVPDDKHYILDVFHPSPSTRLERCRLLRKRERPRISIPEATTSALTAAACSYPALYLFAHHPRRRTKRRWSLCFNVIANYTLLATIGLRIHLNSTPTRSRYISLRSTKRFPKRFATHF